MFFLWFKIYFKKLFYCFDFNKKINKNNQNKFLLLDAVEPKIFT